MTRRFAGLTIVMITGAWLATANAGTRFHEYTKKWKTPPNPAEIVQASYFGGPGSEWLAGGGLLPDGRIFLAGSTLGPSFAIGNARVTVIGVDGQAPGGLEDAAEAQAKIDKEYAEKMAAFEKLPEKKRRRPPRKERYRRPEPWKMPEATGFAALLSKDGRRIEALCRLGWQAGRITSAVVASDGALYVGGIVGPNDAALKATHVPLKPEDYKGGNVPDGYDFKAKIFVGQLKPDLTGFVWVCTLDEFDRFDVKLAFRQDGLLHVEAGHRYLFNRNGKFNRALKTWQVKSWARGVDPETGATAVGADNMTGTGREPWRQPVMKMVREDGTIYNLYAWSGVFVGMDSLRLVSDSSFKDFAFAKDGSLYIYGWSDGGNTVLGRNPFDVRESSPHKGLGMSMWGAHATSGCHLIHVDPETGQVLGQTVWMGYLTKKNEPSGTSIDTMHPVGSVGLALTGGCGWGIIQTGNNLWPEEQWETVRGSFLTVMTPDLGELRFSSGMLACAAYKVGLNRSWGLSDAVVDGRVKVLAVTNAEAGQNVAGTHYPAPSRNSFQEKFGGGGLDGHFTILDLGPASK